MNPDATRSRNGRGPLRRLKHALRDHRRRRSENRPPPGPRIRLGEDPLEVHSVVCSAHVPMSLWSLSSFVAFSGARPRVVIHDDGTLTADDRALYVRYFEGIEILDARRMDLAMARALADHPVCAAFRAREDFYCARKLFDILFTAERDHLLVLDSDILFFARPAHLLDRLREGVPFFNADYQDSYGAPREVLSDWAGFDIYPRVNAGLLGVPVAAYRSQLDRIERYLAFAQASLPQGQVNKHEQTSHALVMTVLEGERLPPAYQIDGELDAGTVSHHFVHDGRQRGRFWYRGVRRIRREVARRLARMAAD